MPELLLLVIAAAVILVALLVARYQYLRALRALTPDPTGLDITPRPSHPPDETCPRCESSVTDPERRALDNIPDGDDADLTSICSMAGLRLCHCGCAESEARPANGLVRVLRAGAVSEVHLRRRRLARRALSRRRRTVQCLSYSNV